MPSIGVLTYVVLECFSLSLYDLGKETVAKSSINDSNNHRVFDYRSHLDCCSLSYSFDPQLVPSLT